MRIRVVPTASGKHAIQVVSKQYGKVTVHKHIGSYDNDQGKLKLQQKAIEFIQHKTGQINLLDQINTPTLTDVIITQSKSLFSYQILSAVYDKLGFGSFSDSVIKDLVISRIYHPSSKLSAWEDMQIFFGRSFSLKTIYRHVKNSLAQGVKEKFQDALITFAKDKLDDNLQLIFYDVTTLAFDSQVKTQLKSFGFSKDHRFGDLQIIIGLVVNKAGFPLYFDVFSGETFEGNTFLEVVSHIKTLLKVDNLVVVADAAMLSEHNIHRLREANIQFIVGARLSNLPQNLIDSISSELKAQDGKITATNYKGQKLICEYSAKRAAKDRSDRLKQIEKANIAISIPSGVTKRFRFIRQEGKTYSLNTDLINKAEKLEGIKGYITNTKLPSQLVILRYHDLWQIEKSFRITKSDLEARPIFHQLDETIKAHMVIVFAGLAITKYIEFKTSLSIKRVLKLSNQVLTHTVKNIKTGEIMDMETTIEDPKLKQAIESLRAVGH